MVAEQEEDDVCDGVVGDNVIWVMMRTEMQSLASQTMVSHSTVTLQDRGSVQLRVCVPVCDDAHLPLTTAGARVRNFSNECESWGKSSEDLQTTIAERASEEGKKGRLIVIAVGVALRGSRQPVGGFPLGAFERGLTCHTTLFLTLEHIISSIISMSLPLRFSSCAEHSTQ